MTDAGQIAANVKKSAAAGNILVLNEDGLFVPEAFIKLIEDTATVNLEVDEAGKLTAEVKISAAEGNMLVAKEDGLFMAVEDVDLSGYYTSEQVDALLEPKADKETVNAALDLKANAADVYAKTETYNKEEIDAALALKANAADVYTKAEIDAINAWKSIEA